MLREDISTIQEAFDYVTEKLVLQGERCMVDNYGSEFYYSCSYGDGNGGNCGIGKLLDPNDVTLMLYKGGVGDLYNEYPDKMPKVINSKNLPFLNELQWFHDSGGSDDRYKVLNTMMNEHKITINNGYAMAWVNLGTGETIYE